MAQWYHVFPMTEQTSYGLAVTGWVIKGEDNERISRKYDERHMGKAQVISKAKDLATPYNPGVVIHNNDGYIIDIWVNSEYTTNVDNSFSTPKPTMFPRRYQDGEVRA